MIRIFLFVILCLPSMIYAQNKKLLTLQDCIAEAQSHSPKFRLVQTKRDISQFQYQSFATDFHPQVSFYGNAPVYSKIYNSVTQPDGTIKFLPIQQNISNIGFSLSQQLFQTGGSLSLNTDLSHFYDFQSRFNQFNGTPIFIRLNQPLFGFNEFKWKRKIEPLKLEEAKREYLQEFENIAQEIITLYFNILDALNNIEIAKNNLEITGTNYEIEKKKINLGTTTEDKLLQLELQFLKNKQDLEKAKYNLKISELKMRTYLGEKDETVFLFSIPDEYPKLEINLQIAIEFAKKTRSEFITFERKKLESQRDVSQANSAGKEIALVASYGLNNASNNLAGVYSGAQDQQRFSVNFSVPILDWGRRKARKNTADALEKLTDFNNEFDEQSIIQELLTLVNNIELLRNNIEISKKTDSVALRRFILASNLYQIGKLSITELYLAQSEKDNSKRSYVSSLREYWNSIFLLRRLTMYDFDKKEAIYIR